MFSILPHTELKMPFLLLNSTHYIPLRLARKIMRLVLFILIIKTYELALNYTDKSWAFGWVVFYIRRILIAGNRTQCKCKADGQPLIGINNDKTLTVRTSYALDAFDSLILLKSKTSTWAKLQCHKYRSYSFIVKSNKPG